MQGDRPIRTPGAIVLCGGMSRRMGHPKAWLPFGGETLLARVVRQMAEEARTVVVVAAPDQVLPELPPGVDVARDPVAGLGPLRGFATGLHALPGDLSWVALTAADSPFLAPGWIARLADRIAGADAAIPVIDGRPHPLSAAIYRPGAVRPVVDDLLAAGERRLMSLLERVDARRVGADELHDVDPGYDTIRNVNTPEDYARALLDAGFGGSDPGISGS